MLPASTPADGPTGPRSAEHLPPMPDPSIPSHLPTAAFLAAIIDGSDDVIVTKNLQGIVTSWNRGAERVFGYRPEEMIGRPILTLLPPDRQDEEKHILARLQRGERVEHFETRRVRKDGRLIEVSLTISPIRDANGAVIGASKIARDVTELKQARDRLQRHTAELELKVRERTARLEESLAELEAFSYSLSHDMRAPLRAIQSLTEIVVEDYGERFPEGVPLLKRVIGSAARLDRLIRDVLSFAQLSRTDIPLAALSADAVVRDILRERPEYHPPHADIVVEGELPPVIGHNASLTQCLANLIDNAVKFVSPGVTPVVRIFGERTGDRVRISVRDNGIGIDQQNRQRLFEIFQRLPSSSGYEGTGVGLAIVRKAVARMNGTVGVDSAPGLGSTFWLELPAVTP
jgi:PAS domain S-box-containing protein